MTGYNLLENYTDDPEALLRKNRSHTASSSATPPTVELVTPHHQLMLLWPRHSVTTPPPLLPTCPLGPLSTQELETLSYALA